MRARPIVLGLVAVASLVSCADTSEPAAPAPVATTDPEPPPLTTPTATAPASTSVPAPARTPLPGFDEIAARITDANGTVIETCLLLADDAVSQNQGLMEVTDPTLGGYDGMLFTFEEPTATSFYMLRTRLALSLAWFDGSAYLGAVDMAPCPDDDDEPRCPRYLAPAPFTAALEVPVGGLSALGVRAGSTLAAGGACAPPS